MTRTPKVRRPMTQPPFDGNDYRKRVLAAVDARGGLQASDPFECYDLPLQDAEQLADAVVSAQLDAVWAFWQKSRDHPKYRGLVTALLSVHDRVAPMLRSRDNRGHLAEDARRTRALREQGRSAELDAAIERLVERFGGIPRGKLEGLRRLAAAAGLDGASTESRLARHPLLDDVAAARATAVPAAVYRQVRGDLDELGRLLGDTPPASLYDLIGLPPGASAQEVLAERDVAATRNRELRPDRRRALVDDLLAAVTTLLVDGDPEAYLDAVAEDVTARLRPRVAAAILVEDELTVDDHEHLLAVAEAAGLDRGRAVQVLAGLAREAGVRAPQAGNAATPAGGTPARPTPVRGTPAWDRKRTGSATRSAPPPVPTAGAWSRPLSEARAALRAGQVMQAQRLLSEARQLAGGFLPPIRALDDEVVAVLGEAQQRWRTVEQALLASRFTEAAAALERLVQVAVDLPSPRGTSVSDALQQARAGLEAAGARLAAADTLTGTPRELALLEAVRLAPDHEGLLAALSAGGVAPPTDVRAELVGGGVRVSWQASTSPGALDYKVRRADGRTVGTTQTTELEDGVPPGGGPLPTYVVVARRAGIVSTEASSASPPDAPPDALPDAVPPAVTSLVVLPMGARLRLVFTPPARGRVDIRRLPDGVPAPEPGTVVADPARLGEAVPGMGPGLAVDRRPSVPYVCYVALTVDGAVITGAAAAYVDVPPVSGLQVQDDRLRWQWPPGCTEVLVTWRGNEPPQHAHEPQATTRKITNTRYEIDGGVPLPPGRPLHIAVFPATRVRGVLHPSNDAPAGARLELAGGSGRQDPD